MKKPDPNALQLACARCGLNMHVYATKKQYVCKHCGTPQVTNGDSRGTILKAFHDSGLTEYESAAFDPNDELARARHALLAARAKLHQRSHHWNAFRQNRMDEWDVKRNLAQLGGAKVRRTTALIMPLPAALVGWAAFSVGKHYLATGGALAIAGLVFMAFCAGTMAIVREMVRTSDKYDLEKFAGQAAEEFAIMDGRMSSETEAANKEIIALEEEVKRLEQLRPPPQYDISQEEPGFGDIIFERDLANS